MGVEVVTAIVVAVATVLSLIAKGIVWLVRTGRKFGESWGRFEESLRRVEQLVSNHIVHKLEALEAGQSELGDRMTRVETLVETHLEESHQ